jgi:hypothetical protein
MKGAQNMGIKIFFMLIGLAIISVTMILACSRPKEQSVTYKLMNQGDYQNFLINWDEQKYAVLYALVQDSAQYNALFKPAALNGDMRPFSPEAELFSKEQILLVARVIAATEDMNKVFRVERIIEKNQVLTLNYLYSEPEIKETYFVKNYLAIQIPRQAYKQVVFFENNQKIGELNIAVGQWSVPEISIDSNNIESSQGK